MLRFAVRTTIVRPFSLKNRSFASLPGTVYTPTLAVSDTFKELAEKESLFRDGVSPDRIFDAIDRLGPLRIAPGLVQSSFRTQGHTQLYDILLNYSENLRNDRYRDTRGVATALLVGAKGIGKTTSLLAFTNILSAFNSSVVPVYVSFNTIHIDGDNPLRTNSLLKAVCNSLGVKNGNPFALVDALEERGKHLLLMVDELDQLYLEEPTEIHRTTLSELAFLGDQPSGRISTLLCGSSAALPNLITRNFKDFDEWPLLRKAPNLNGTKYSTRRVFTAPPVALQDLDSILRLPEGPEKIKNLRRVAFATGCRARLVQRIVTDLAAGDFFQACFPEESTQGHNTLKVPIRKELRARILQKMRSKNAQLFNDLCLDGVPNLDRIAEVNWEERFQPLLWSEAEIIWREITRTEPMEGLFEHVLHLSDRSWLMTTKIVDSVPRLIYPSSLYGVLHATESSPHMETFRGRFWNSLKKIPIGGLMPNFNFNYDLNSVASFTS